MALLKKPGKSTWYSCNFMQIRVVFVLFPTFFPIPQKSSSPPKSFCLTPSCCKKNTLFCCQIYVDIWLDLQIFQPTETDFWLDWPHLRWTGWVWENAQCLQQRLWSVDRTGGISPTANAEMNWYITLEKAGFSGKYVVHFKNFITNIFEYHCNINFYLYIFWIPAIKVTSTFFQPMSGETEIPVRYSTSPCGISPTFLKIHSVFA